MTDTSGIYGIGKGAAQIVNVGQSVNTFMRLSQMKAQQDAQDQRAVADMLSKIQPDKLRAADMNEFNTKYNELKGIYAQNKDLYRNPLKHQDAYNRAQNLASDLRQLASDSKDVEGFTGEVGKIFMKDKDQLEDNMPEFLNSLKNKPVSELRAAFGRLPDYSDVQFKPQPINWDEVGKDVLAFATSTGGVKDVPVVEKGEKNGVPLGKIRYRTDKQLDPISVGARTEHYYKLNDTFRKNMTREFGMLSPEEQEVFQDPQEYAKAQVMGKVGLVRGKDQLVEDEDYNRQVRADERAQSQGFQREQEQTRFQHNLESQKYGASLRTDPNKTDEDKLMKDSQSLINELNSGKHPTEINKKMGVIRKGDSMFYTKPYYISDKTHTATTYVSSYVNANKPLKGSLTPERRAALQDEARDLYNRKATLLIIPKKDNTGNFIGNTIIDPTANGAEYQMYEFLQQATGAKRKYGVMDGVDKGNN